MLFCKDLICPSLTPSSGLFNHKQIVVGLRKVSKMKNEPTLYYFECSEFRGNILLVKVDWQAIVGFAPRVVRNGIYEIVL